MEINGKQYSLNDLRAKMPKYDMFLIEKVAPGSQDDKLDKEPIATTSPNLHLRHNPSQVVVRGEGEIEDRKYHLLGLIGTKAYSSRQKFIHDDNLDNNEVP